jgi:catechol 2,3-dioxygenase-like lactoylglutathione lyase family enzyme
MRSTLHQPVPELPVRDVEKSQAFYRDKLGFEIGWLEKSKGIGAVSKGEVVIFLRKQEDVTPHTLWVFADDVDEMYKELVQANLTISEDLETKPWGLRQFTIEDLDGNRFIFHHDI